MQFLLKSSLFVSLLVLLAACDGLGSQSSVPRMPVNVTIDTRQGEFVHFTREALNTYVIIDKDENGEYTTKLFAKEQSYKSMLKILGY